MTKKVIFILSIIINIILGIVLVCNLIGASENLKFEYVEEDTIRPDSLRMYLDMQNYGVAASLSHPIRGGAQIAAEDADYYRLGEYADLLFLKAIFDKSGNTDTLKDCKTRLAEIREEMPDYGILFDKIEQSAEQAIVE